MCLSSLLFVFFVWCCLSVGVVVVCYSLVMLVFVVVVCCCCLLLFVFLCVRVVAPLLVVHLSFVGCVYRFRVCDSL